MLCNSCNSHFADEGARSAHYRSDWHRYNLKRKVAGLPGVTEEWFEMERAAVAAALAAEASGCEGHKDPLQRLECAACSKQYASRKAFENHLHSKGHAWRAALAPAGSSTSDPVMKVRKAPAGTSVGSDSAQSSGSGEARLAGNPLAEARLAGDGREICPPNVASGVKAHRERQQTADAVARQADAEEELQVSVDEDVGEGKEVEDEEEAEERHEEGEGEWSWDCSRCLFCDKSFQESGGVEECVTHMHKAHGFFLPDAEHISDLAGLLTYLALKVNRGRLCLYCDKRRSSFRSAAAAKARMEAKSHAKLRYGDGSGVAEEVLEDFYDFSPRNEDAGTSMQLALGDDATPHASLQKGGTELAITNTRVDGEGSSAPVTRVVGSREFAIYYKQQPRPTESTHKMLSTVVSRYKSLGITTRGLRSHLPMKELE